MEAIKDYDDDGYELEFEDDISAEEKKFYVTKYMNVNMVADKHVHCTCCSMHIGTAPNSEKLIRMHPVLRVTQCVKCFRFYNSGEFDKGEDGSELYCRWCGQGGEVYCCATCPYVFCQKCILRNLTRIGLNDVLSNDNWRCYSCVPKPILNLRAQHWALVNFIGKQQKKIEARQKAGKLDDDEFAYAMRKDVSTCCAIKAKPTSNKRRRAADSATSEEDNDSDDDIWTRRKKSKTKPSEGSKNPEKTTGKKTDDVAVPKPPTATVVSKPPKPSQPSKPSQPPRKSPPAATAQSSAQSTDKVKDPSAQIDCTPDLFSYLLSHSLTGGNEAQNQAQPPARSTQAQPPVRPAQAQPPARPTPANAAGPSRPTRPSRPPSARTLPSSIDVRRVSQQQNAAQVPPAPGLRRPSQNRPTAPADAIFHNYNGYRINLTDAAQQNGISLPNGRMIQVRRQIMGQPRHPGPSSMQGPPHLQMIQPNAGQMRPTRVLRPVSHNPRPQIRQPRAPQNGAHIYSVAQAQSTMMQQMQQMQQGSIQRVVTNPQSRQMASNQLTQNQQQQQQQQQQQPQSHQLQQQQQQQQPLQKQVYPDTAIGRARTQLEGQIFGAMEICHQINSKLRTLMNSNAYKSASKKTDIKELYIHLSYLFTYTNGRFQTLQDKCMEDMRQLGYKKDAGTLSAGNVVEKYGSDIEDDEEIAIVEPNHATINLDSDEERTPKKKTPIKASGRPSMTSTPATATVVAGTPATELTTSPVEVSTVRAADSAMEVEAVSVTEVEKTDVIRVNTADQQDETPTIEKAVEDVECDVDISAMLQLDFGDDDDDNLNDEEESLMDRMHERVEIATPPPMEMDVEVSVTVNVNEDSKLKSPAQVVLTRAEIEYPDKVVKSLTELQETNACVESVENVATAGDKTPRATASTSNNGTPQKDKEGSVSDYFENDVISLGSDDDDDEPNPKDDEKEKGEQEKDDQDLGLALLERACESLDDDNAQKEIETTPSSSSDDSHRPSMAMTSESNVEKVAIKNQEEEEEEEEENSLLEISHIGERPEEIEIDDSTNNYEVEEVDTSSPHKDVEQSDNENVPSLTEEPEKSDTAIPNVDEDEANSLLEISHIGERPERMDVDDITDNCETSEMATQSPQKDNVEHKNIVDTANLDVDEDSLLEIAPTDLQPRMNEETVEATAVDDDATSAMVDCIVAVEVDKENAMKNNVDDGNVVDPLQDAVNDAELDAANPIQSELASIDEISSGLESVANIVTNADPISDNDDIFDSINRLIEEASHAMASNTTDTDAASIIDPASNIVSNAMIDGDNLDALLMDNAELENISSPDEFNEYAKNGGSPSELADALADLIPEVEIPIGE